MLERVLVALLAGGHVLLEGVPGLAKTLTVRTLADVARRHASAACSSRPTSCPPTSSARASGSPTTGEFKTELGPVFANLLLADEINRAPAKVQSALLEVMQEHQVTIGGTHLRGARAVPRARDAEPDRVRGHLRAARGAGRPLPVQARRRLPGARGRGRRRARHRRRRRRAPRRSCSPRTCCATAPAAATVHVDREVATYAVQLVDATRHPAERGLRRHRAAASPFGASPRASIGLVQSARRRWRCCAAARTSPPPTSTTSRATCCATGSCCPTTRSPTASRADEILDRVLEAVAPAGRVAARRGRVT